MRPGYNICPKLSCRGQKITKFGSYRRSSDSRTIHRFRCKSCKKTFSQASFDPCFAQKKRRLNPKLEKLLCSGVSMREAARLLNTHFITVSRKKRFLALQARAWLFRFLDSYPRVKKMQFDDMESFEHSKCKPISITLAVEKKSRMILGLSTSEMPAKGLLTKKAYKKYGSRRDLRKQGRRTLFARLRKYIEPYVEIESDKNPHYPPDVKEYFPLARYQTYKGRRGCVVGQGELKAGGFDPLFSLNHTCAMLRANINRLFRRTWCTSKLQERLEDHIYIYIKKHNQRLLKAAT